MGACSINTLRIGQKGIVMDLAGDDQIVQRLLEMGVTPGCPVQIIRYAPMGDPVEIKVRGYHLTIRKKEADMILVDPQ
ncbi:MAG TPA: ferrous iron transport protein A [Candidatus Omnitrophota bacterium]|jgi:Fe2+ transport system protein FeoA|nr:ferrous iron transport protein A [Candidatus Omnitrophota bacterium]HPN56690.1 ferrous iron transport protein A [Candidatus Omnitrophota bacterium]